MPTRGKQELWDIMAEPLPHQFRGHVHGQQCEADFRAMTLSVVRTNDLILSEEPVLFDLREGGTEPRPRVCGGTTGPVFPPPSRMRLRHGTQPTRAVTLRDASAFAEPDGSGSMSAGPLAAPRPSDVQAFSRC